ncbi:hypothetical protein BDV26DRAFT_253000 [Aspergillus bertholletiae]|uniref:Uncharacterized protein n=1 Tax=Aspergillus bertholletiae TaxID=1226010 RepID=A0A5N7BLU6_9EURO|nr:hypothetical protein BDV26DRAFT_253000 [Aspergillus bertholletiae]
MSGPGDDRWRGGRTGHDQNRQSGQRHSLHRTMSAQSGPRGGQNQNTWGESRDQLSTGPTQEQHVPVGGFNAAEAKGVLRRNPREPKPSPYKPGGKDTNRSGPWGSKSNTMANGKDFFLELRKQITTLRQGDNVAGG